VGGGGLFLLLPLARARCPPAPPLLPRPFRLTLSRSRSLPHSLRQLLLHPPVHPLQRAPRGLMHEHPIQSLPKSNLAEYSTRLSPPPPTRSCSVTPHLSNFITGTRERTEYERRRQLSTDGQSQHGFRIVVERDVSSRGTGHNVVGHDVFIRAAEHRCAPPRPLPPTIRVRLSYLRDAHYPQRWRTRAASNRPMASQQASSFPQRHPWRAMPELGNVDMVMTCVEGRTVESTEESGSR
jgi:hypothetical protein